MDQSAPLSAYHVINEYSYHELVKIFFRYGEEKFSKQIAREIERVRKTKPIQTTGELVEIIKQVIPAPARRKGGHPAKRIFQAVRIAVNDELGAEEASLEQAIRLLKVNGRISVITFHSLEDRIVKSMFKEYSTVQDLPPGLPVIPDEFQPELKVITRKPILPSEEELTENNRSRSAKLRIAEKIRMKEERMMAELKKMQDYEYDLPELVDQPEQQMPDSSSNQEIILPQSPAKRLKQISALEKIAVASVAIAIVALCVLTVMLRTNISGAEKEITSIQTEINDKKQEKTSLEQEKKRTFSY